MADGQIGCEFEGVMSFRAECGVDVRNLFDLLSKERPGCLTFNWHRDDGEFPDVEIEIETRNGLTIGDVHGAMRRVVDGHVMAETLRALPLAENDMTRRYSERPPSDWSQGRRGQERARGRSM